MAVELAAKTIGVEITWSAWATAAIVVAPADAGSIHEMPHAKQMAVEKMGPMSWMEKVVLAVFVLAGTLGHVVADAHGMRRGVGMLAVTVLLLTNVLTWQDVRRRRAPGTRCSGWAP